MFFVLSKTLNYFTMPLVIVVLLMGLSFLVKKKWLRKRFRVIGFVLLLFFSNDFVANEIISIWELDPIPYATINDTYDVGVILTGVTANDRQPDDRVYFSHGADRVTHTVDLYKRGIIRRILISGGSGRLVTKARLEADEIRKAMLLMGVPDSVMTTETSSRNTHESAVEAKALLPGSEKILLVTSSFHMRRSVACFLHEGLQVDPFPTDFYSHPRYFTLDVLIIPKVESIRTWHILLKEWTGMLAYWVAGYI